MPAKERKYPGSWPRFLKSVKKTQPWCRICLKKGIKREAQEIDHIIPLKDGGSSEMKNLQPLCKPCHARKTLRDNNPLKGLTPEGFPAWRLKYDAEQEPI